MDCSDIEVRPDHERVFAHRATVELLACFIEANIPWVWILDHRPNRYLEWWTTTLALNTKKSSYTGLVRSICLDIQMPTAQFLSRATDFNDHGMTLIQSSQKMPDTLALESIPEAAQRKVLVQNGASLRILLPHAGETALVESFNSGHLASVIGPNVT